MAPEAEFAVVAAVEQRNSLGLVRQKLVAGTFDAWSEMDRLEQARIAVVVDQARAPLVSRG